jgi:hypothetical protein
VVSVRFLWAGDDADARRLAFMASCGFSLMGTFHVMRGGYSVVESEEIESGKGGELKQEVE